MVLRVHETKIGLKISRLDPSRVLVKMHYVTGLRRSQSIDVMETPILAMMTTLFRSWLWLPEVVPSLLEDLRPRCFPR